MIAYTLDDPGFLTRHSSLGADLSLLVSFAAVVLLTAGVALARRRRFEAHRWVQSTAVVLSAILVAVWMLRSLWLYILPGLPGTLGDRGHALAAVHAATGAVGVALGVVLVVQGNRLMARRDSLSRYRNAMRLAYVVYVVGFAFGLALYLVTYG